MVIWAVYQAARFVFPDDDLFALTSAGALAFIPQFNFISASLRNDTVNNALSALCLVALLTIIARPTQYQWRAAFGIGGLLALAVLTKATAAFLLPTALVACACAPHSWRQRAQMAGAILIAFTLFVTAYFALYDEARIALDYSLTHATIASDHLELSYWLLIPLAMRDMFWARFGWANVSVSRTWINTATVLGLGGFTVSIARWCTWARRREWFGSTENRLLIVLFVALVGNLAVFVRYNLYEYQPQGRFLFPSLIALIILALWGPWQILPPKGRTLAAIMVPVAMLVFNLYALSTLIAAYY
jgi:hypothetical protein